MFLIDGLDTSPTLPPPGAPGIASGWFQSPAPGQEGTQVTADWLNGVQGELVNYLVDRGITLDKNDNSQLSKALAAESAYLSGAIDYVSGQIPISGEIKGWAIVDLTGTATIVASSDNVDSITDNGTGDFTLSGSFPSSPYGLLGTAGYIYDASNNNTAKIAPSRRDANALNSGYARIGVTNNVTGTEVSVDAEYITVTFIGGV